MSGAAPLTQTNLWVAQELKVGLDRFGQVDANSTSGRF